MSCLTEENIQFILEDIERRGLNYKGLKEEVLDHICIDVEAGILEGLSFEQAYKKISGEFGEYGLQEIQENTIFILNYKFILMKRALYILLIFAVYAILHRTNHLQGAGWLIALSLTFVSVLLIIFSHGLYKDKRRPVWNRFLALYGYTTSFLIITGHIIWWKFYQYSKIGMILTIISITAYGTLCLIYYLSNIKVSENKSEKKKNKILSVISAINLLLVVFDIIWLFTGHPNNIFVIIIAGFNLFIALPILLITGYFKEILITSLVIFYFIVYFRALPGYITDKINFSQEYQVTLYVKQEKPKINTPPYIIVRWQQFKNEGNKIELNKEQDGLWIKTLRIEGKKNIHYFISQDKRDYRVLLEENDINWNVMKLNSDTTIYLSY